MKNALEYIVKNIDDSNLVKMTMSSPKVKSQEIKKITIRSIKDQKYQAEIQYIKHNNIITLSSKKLINELNLNWLEIFKQLNIETNLESVQVLINKKGTAKFIYQKKSEVNRPHNRKKNYLIPDNEKCDFLIELGIMSKSGNVLASGHKKFRQINRYLELVDDIVKDHDLTQVFTAIDFGCGKSYLTFALYYYFDQIKKIPARIIGLDLKQDVIESANRLATKLHYSGLSFKTGFIKDYDESQEDIDLVITLHACDTATDEAILFSLKNQAKRMMFVPCCQHELNTQLKHHHMSPLLESGILRDKLTALITDASRAKYIEAKGYKVQVMEFIDLEHTPKNVLIRCVRSVMPASRLNEAIDHYNDFINEWSITPYLHKKAALTQSPS